MILVIIARKGEKMGCAIVGEAAMKNEICSSLIIIIVNQSLIILIN